MQTKVRAKQKKASSCSLAQGVLIFGISLPLIPMRLGGTNQNKSVCFILLVESWTIVFILFDNIKKYIFERSYQLIATKLQHNTDLEKHFTDKVFLC